MNKPGDRLVSIKVDTLMDWKIALHGVTPSDRSGIDTVLAGIKIEVEWPHFDNLAQQLVALRQEWAGLRQEWGALEAALTQPDPEIEQAARAIEEMLTESEKSTSIPVQPDVFYASDQRAAVSVQIDELTKSLPVDPGSLRRVADKIEALDVQFRLWSDVLASGWDTAVSLVGEYYRDVWLSTMAEQQRTAVVKARAAQLWWRHNHRRALTEGLDIEALAGAMI